MPTWGNMNNVSISSSQNILPPKLCYPGNSLFRADQYPEVF